MANELTSAIAGQSMTRLQQAITKAGQHGVDTTKGRARLTELREAERARAKQAAADELASAMAGEDMPKLQQAITKAQQHEIDTADASARLTQLIEAAEAAERERQAVREWVAVATSFVSWLFHLKGARATHSSIRPCSDPSPLSCLTIQGSVRRQVYSQGGELVVRKQRSRHGTIRGHQVLVTRVVVTRTPAFAPPRRETLDA